VSSWTCLARTASGGLSSSLHRSLSPSSAPAPSHHQGRFEPAEEMLNQWRRDKQHVDIKLYRLLMEGYLRAGRLRMARQTFRLILTDHKMPDAASYFLMVVCHGLEMEEGGGDNERRREKVRNILKRMRSEGHSPTDVYRHLMLSPKHRDVLVRTVRSVWPDFDPSNAHLVPESWRVASCDADDRWGGRDEAAASPVGAGGLSGAALEQWRRETATVVGVPVILTDKARRERDALLKRRRNKAAKAGIPVDDADADWDSEDGATLLPKLVPRVESVLARERAKWEAAQVFGGRGRRRGYDDDTAQMFALSDNTLAAITCAEVGDRVLQTLPDFGVPLIPLCQSIGRQVFLRHFVESQTKAGVPEVLAKVYPAYESRVRGDMSEVPRDTWADEVEARNLIDEGVSLLSAQWPESTMVKVGSALVDAVLRCARLRDLPANATALVESDDLDAEALYHTYIFEEGKVRCRCSLAG
jgi:hypothetical protein